MIYVNLNDAKERELSFYLAMEEYVARNMKEREKVEEAVSMPTRETSCSLILQKRTMWDSHSINISI